MLCWVIKDAELLLESKTVSVTMFWGYFSGYPSVELLVKANSNSTVKRT